MKLSPKSFASQTTVHGLHIIGLPKLHFLERLFWSAVVLMAAIGAIAIANSNWIRYQANPTVVSLQKDFRNWKNPFPSVTGCFLNKINKNKADEYIQKKWGINSSEPSYNYYLDFIKTVANISYGNLNEFGKFVNDSRLLDANMLEIATAVHPELSGTLVTFDPKHPSNWSLILSEMGICFSVNSMFVNLLSLNLIDVDVNVQVCSNPNKTLLLFRKSQINGSTNSHKILECHYLNGLCYARYNSDPKLPLKYYIHSYLDVIHATIEPPLLVHESEELEINYRMQETESSLALRQLTPNQRKCRFYDEPITNDVPVYSSSICYIMCRHKIALALCGCKPFFYHNLGGKVCNVKGMVCLSNHSKYITKPPSQLGCYCPQPCNIVTYFPQVPKYTRWENGYFEQRITFRWGLLPPTTKLHRDVLFGFEDLVVSFGGTLALFLGISFISAIEILFLVMENLYIYFKNKSKVVLVHVRP